MPNSRTPIEIEKHNKLGNVVDSNLNDFKLLLRLPHWKPDEIVRRGDTTMTPKAVYVEEALYADPNSYHREPFLRCVPSPNDTQWILGYGFKADSSKPFDTWLSQFIFLIYKYNRALYRIRMLHLVVENNAIYMESLPNEEIDDPRLQIAVRCKNAEEHYSHVNSAIRNWIDTGYNQENKKQEVIVDAIQVNGYIASIRVVGGIFTGQHLAKEDGDKAVRGPQPGGSVSSHISIPGPFSSPK